MASTTNLYDLASLEPALRDRQRQELLKGRDFETTRIKTGLTRERVGAFRARLTEGETTDGEQDLAAGVAFERSGKGGMLPEKGAGERSRRIVERSMDYLETPSEHLANLPPDDLMKHIYRRTTHLYSQRRPEDHGEALLDEEAWAALRFSRCRKSAQKERSPGPDQDLESEGEDTDVENEEEEAALLKALEGGSQTAPFGLKRTASRTSMGSQGRKRIRNAQVKKNMYKALTGDTLIALGILMEEFIKYSLHETGYPDPTGGGLDLNAASDEEVVGASFGVPSDEETKGNVGLELGDQVAKSDDSSAQDHDDDDDDEEETSSSGESDASGTASDVSSNKPPPSKPRKSPVAVKDEDEERRRKRLFRDEEDRYQEMLDSGQAVEESGGSDLD